MASEVESPTVEWREDARLLTLCIQCDKELAPDQARCPTCQSPASSVHRCPKCARVVAAKHLRCPYCQETFLKNEPQSPRRAAVSGVFELQRQLSNVRELQQRRKVLWFCLAVFMTVFVLAVAIERYRPGGSGPAVVLGSSFVLHDVPLRQQGSSQGSILGRVAPPTVVDITGVERDELGQGWFQVRWGEGTAYVPVTSLAPPKGRSAEGGYTLLRASLTDLADPAELGDATDAVRLFRNTYPGNPHGEELLWILAEKTRELGRRKRDAGILARARKAYDEVARERGQHADAAAAALAGLPETSPAPPEGRPSAPGPASGDAPEWRVYDPKARANKIMLLNETEVSVAFSDRQALKEGEVLAGHVARAVVSNGETVIPAGSLCRVKVGPGAARGSADLALVEIQIGSQSYAVEAAPVRVRVGQPLGRTRLLFRLRRSLVLAQ